MYSPRCRERNKKKHNYFWQDWELKLVGCIARRHGQLSADAAHTHFLNKAKRRNKTTTRNLKAFSHKYSEFKKDYVERGIIDSSGRRLRRGRGRNHNIPSPAIQAPEIIPSSSNHSIASILNGPQPNHNMDPFNSMFNPFGKIPPLPLMPHNVLTNSLLDGVDDTASQQSRQFQQDPPARSTVECLQIFIKTLDGTTISLDAEPNASVQTVKSMIYNKTGIDTAEQRLTYKGKELEDHQHLNDYAVEGESTLHLAVRLRAGAVTSTFGWIKFIIIWITMLMTFMFYAGMNEMEVTCNTTNYPEIASSFISANGVSIIVPTFNVLDRDLLCLTDSRSGGDDDKKSSISSQRDEPQRMKKTKKKKRKRRRGRKQQQHQEQDEEEEDDDDDDDDEQDDISQNEENDELSANESSTKSRSPSQPQKSAKQQQGKKKKITLNDKLKNLNLRNITSSRQQLNEWINLLRDNDKFLNSFISENGLSHIICKMILDLSGNGDIDIFSKYSVDIINLFDILLCDTHSYHEWLSDKLQRLSDRKPNNLQCIICEQVAHLIDAQLSRHDDRIKCEIDNDSDNSIKRDSSFSKPSCLLHSRHKEHDLIVPAFDALNRDLLSLSDLYHNLVLHDNRIKLSCPTSSDSFIASYDSIKQELSCSIQLISIKSGGLEQELFAIKNEQNSISRQENEELIPLKQNLLNLENEKYRLQQEYIRIESELTDKFIEQTKCQILEIEIHINRNVINYYIIFILSYMYVMCRNNNN